MCWIMFIVICVFILGSVHWIPCGSGLLKKNPAMFCLINSRRYCVPKTMRAGRHSPRTEKVYSAFQTFEIGIEPIWSAHPISSSQFSNGVRICSPIFPAHSPNRSFLRILQWRNPSGPPISLVQRIPIRCVCVHRTFVGYTFAKLAMCLQSFRPPPENL